MVRWLRLLWLMIPSACWLLLDYLLHGQGTYHFLIFYSLLPLLGFLAFMIPKAEKYLRWSVYVLLLVYSVILIMEILMMPYQAFNIWFDLLNHGASRGRVSQLFIKLAGLFSSFIAWYLTSRKKWDLGLLYLPAFFLFLLFPNIGTALAALVLFLLPKLFPRAGWRLYLISAWSILLGFTGINSQPRGIGIIDNSPGNLYSNLIERFPNLPLVYQIPLYGESLSEQVEDGGSPILTNRNLLKVSGPAGSWVYLRSKIYRDITPSGAIISVPNPLHRDDLLQGSERPLGAIIHVTLLSDYMNMVPLTLKTSLIQTTQGSYIWDKPSQSLVWSDPPMIYEEDYILFEESNKKELQPTEDLKGYLTMPVINSQSLKDLARNLRGADDLETVRNIQNHLLKNYSYTQDTIAQNDYVDYFLFQSKEGYCLHFAYSFLKLARLNGIPCRMAEGYITYLPGMDVLMEGGIPGEAIITGYSAHNWPEVYLQEQGWIKVEVTPPYYHEESDPSHQRQQSPEELSANQRDQDREQNTYFGFNLYWLIAALILALSFLMIRYIQNSKDSNRRALKHLLSLGKKQNWPLPEKTGWVQWAAHLKDADLKKDLTRIILKYRYSPDSLSSEEKEYLKESPHKLKKSLKEGL